MSQTSYSLTLPTSVAGLDSTMSGEKKIVLSMNNAAEVPFGRIVAKDSGVENGCELPAGGSAVLLGGAVRDLRVEDGSASTDNTYAAKSSVPVMMKGRMWVEIDQNVTTDSAVYVRHTANGGNTKLGACRADADSSNAVLLAGARFISDGTAGGYAEILINRP